MRYRQPVSAPRAKSAKKGKFFDDPINSKDCRVPAPLPSERHALPTPSSPSNRATEALDDLESGDYLKIRAALARIDTEIEAKALLDQLDKPKRPKWQTMLNDWVSVKIPPALFNERKAKLQEREHLHFDYNPSTERMLIKCMTSKMHNAVPNNFQEQAVREKFMLSPGVQEFVKIGTTDEFSDFHESNLNTNTRKEPDVFVQMKGQIFPSIVMEAGWSESERDLLADARLWLWGTEPPVRFVILIEHVETKVLRDDRREDQKEERRFTESEKEERLADGRLIELAETPANNEKLERAWREQLLQLHHDEKLMKPLLGTVQSTLSIYRRATNADDETKIVKNLIHTEEGPRHQDIYRHFHAEIYPEVSEREVKLRWSDILDTRPDEFSPGDFGGNFCIDLQQLCACIIDATKQQARINAGDRAFAILRRRGENIVYPSHSEQKKGVGPNMLDGKAADASYEPSSGSSASLEENPPRKKRRQA